MVVSDGLRSTLIWSKFMPPDPLECCALYVSKKIPRAARAASPHQTHSVCAPPPSSTSGSAPARCYGASDSGVARMNKLRGHSMGTLMQCVHKLRASAGDLGQNRQTNRQQTDKQTGRHPEKFIHSEIASQAVFGHQVTILRSYLYARFKST